MYLSGDGAQAEVESRREEIQRLENVLKASMERLASLEIDLEREREDRKKITLKAESLEKGPVADLAKLRGEFEALVREKAALEKKAGEELALERARAGELEAEREAVRVRALEAERSAKRPAADLAKLRGEFEALMGEKTAFERKAGEELAHARARVGELESEREAARLRAFEAEKSSQGPAADLAKLRGEFEALIGEKAALERKASEELARERARVSELEAEREVVRMRALEAEKSSQGPAADLAKLRGELEALMGEKAALERKASEETASARARVSELEAELEAARVRALEAEKSSQGPAADLAKLRGEFEALIGEKAALENTASEELARERALVRELEREHEIALKRADQTDAGTQALSKELDRVTKEFAQKERTFKETVSEVESRLRETEKQRDAAVFKAEELEREQITLRSKVEDLSKKVVSQIGAPRGEGNLALEQLLENRELDLKQLTGELNSIKNANKALTEAASSAGVSWLSHALRRREPVLWMTLVAGLVAGIGVTRLVSPSSQAPAMVVPSGGDVAQSTATEVGQLKESKAGNSEASAALPLKESEHALAKIASEAAASSSPATTSNVGSAAAPFVPSALVLQPPQGGVSSGMPSRLPDSFLGIRFGSSLSELAGRGQWQETAGRRHRKAELLGAQVEAVLSADEDGRFIMGSYVRVVPRQPAAVAPFLEWAVNSQDAVSALYGEPSGFHQVEGATDAAEVVRRITSGDDYYEAVWEREGEDTMMNLSIRVFNERSVVFRLEYRSRELATAFAQRQAAIKETAPEKTAGEPQK